MSRQHHYLKTLTQYYQDVERGDKTFEVRFNDRNYQVGDYLYLKEFVPPETYTGRFVKKEITYVLADEKYCKEGFAILGFKDC